MSKSRRQRQKRKHKSKVGDQEYRFSARGKPYPVRRSPEHEEDTRILDLQAQIAPLRAALRPFANVRLVGDPSGDHVWLYSGTKEAGDDPPALTWHDFQQAKEVLGDRS